MRILGALQLATRLLLQFRHKLVYDLHVVAVAVAVYYEKVLRVGLLEREVHLVQLVVSVEREQDGADLRGGEHEYNPVRDVRRPKRDLLALLHAKGHEPLGHQINLLAELEPREPEIAVGVHDRIVLAATRNGLVQELPKGVFAGDRQVVPRHARGYALGERRLGRRRSERIGQLELRHIYTLLLK